MLLMEGKKGLILGVANDRSLAWGIASALHRHGATIGFSYQMDILKKRVEPLAHSIGSNFVAECDVLNQDSISVLVRKFRDEVGEIDFLVHSIAFSHKSELRGEYINTTESNFLHTMNVSCYSFTSLCRHAREHMSCGASALCLSYLGAERVMPNYNVMGVAKAALEASVKYLAMDLGRDGIRVNSLSAGPVKTLAASGIDDFKYILQWNQYNSPLRRNITLDDVGGSALYLLSDLSSGVTGENIHVDAGYHVVGMKAHDAPDISVVDDGE